MVEDVTWLSFVLILNGFPIVISTLRLLILIYHQPLVFSLTVTSQRVVTESALKFRASFLVLNLAAYRVRSWCCL
jgi:hypothetical protein